MKKFLAISFMVICFMAMSQVVNAVPLFNANFDSMTAGSAPTVAPAIAGGVTTTPSYVAADDGSVLVQNNWSSGGVTMPGKSLVLTTNDIYCNTIAKFVGADADRQVGVNFQLDFDMMISGASSYAFELTMYNSSSTTAATCVADISYYQPAERFYIASGGYDNNRRGFYSGYDNNMNAHFTVLYDAVNGIVDLKQDGVEVGSVAIAQDMSFRAVQAIGYKAYYKPGQVAIDNIVTIPEPTTISLLALGAFSMIRRKK